MTDLRKAVHQALEALEPYADIKPRDWKTDREKLWRAYDALRAALAQPAEVEPVADERASLIYDSATHAAAMAVFMTRMDAERPDSDDLGISGWLQEAEYRIKRRAKQSLESLLQTAPQTKAEQQEPVGVVG